MLASSSRFSTSGNSQASIANFIRAAIESRLGAEESLDAPAYYRRLTKKWITAD